jgi:hypothetical protein
MEYIDLVKGRRGGNRGRGKRKGGEERGGEKGGEENRCLDASDEGVKSSLTCQLQTFLNQASNFSFFSSPSLPLSLLPSFLPSLSVSLSFFPEKVLLKHWKFTGKKGSVT